MSATPPPTLPYRRFEGGVVRRFLRRGASRENVVHLVKTIAWVGPLTVLIWVYAEREQRKVLKDVPVTLEFRSNVANAIVETREPLVPNVVLELEGSNNGVQRVRDTLYSASRTTTLPILLDSSRTPGREYTLEVARLLNATELLSSNGVTVKSVVPPQLIVYIDETVTRDLPVGKPSEMTNLVGSPEFEPATVKVEGPRRLVDALAPTTTVVADLTPLNLSPGDHTLPSVRLLPLGNGLTLKPGTVQATIAVRDNDVTRVIASMPVWAVVPFGFNDKYEVRYTGFVQNVKVVGPLEQIELIDKGERGGFKPYAQVQIKIEELTMNIPKPVSLVFILPEGVRLVRDSGAPTTVDVTLLPKSGQ